VVGRLARLQEARGQLDSSLVYYNQLQKGVITPPTSSPTGPPSIWEKDQPVKALRQRLSG